MAASTSRCYVLWRLVRTCVVARAVKGPDQLPVLVPSLETFTHSSEAARLHWVSSEEGIQWCVVERGVSGCVFVVPMAVT